MELKGTIIYVGGFELPDKNAAAHRVINNGKAFKELGYNVVYLGVSHEKQQFIKEDFFGFDCFSIGYPKGLKNWLKYLTDIKALKNVISLYDDVVAVVFYNYQAGALKKAIKLCKKLNIKTVADVTEWYMPSKKNPIFYFIKKWDTSLRMKKLQPKMDGVIAISKYLNDYYTAKTKTVLVPPLVDKADEKWNCKTENLPSTPLRLIYAGNSGDVKDNFSLLTSCVEELDGKVELEVIGNVINASTNAKNIRFLGRIPHKDCVEKIANSHFQVFFREDNLVTKAGFPTKLPESLASGTPVITNGHSNVLDYLQDGKNALLISSVTKENIFTVLDRAIKLTNEELNELKAFSKEENAFDYKEYIKVFEGFLSSI